VRVVVWNMQRRQQAWEFLEGLKPDLATSAGVSAADGSLGSLKHSRPGRNRRVALRTEAPVRECGPLLRRTVEASTGRRPWRGEEARRDRAEPSGCACARRDRQCRNVPHIREHVRAIERSVPQAGRLRDHERQPDDLGPDADSREPIHADRPGRRSQHQPAAVAGVEVKLAPARTPSRADAPTP
jgi:hypothetical protein